MIVIGLLGGVGSGKSRVREALAKRNGAMAIDADALGHEVLREPEVRQAIVDRFGREILDREGWIQRAGLAKIVFAESEEGRQNLQWLESLTHPRITARLLQQLDEARSAKKVMVILDAPVLLKAGWDRLCDHLIFVEAPWERRRERVSTRGWSEAELRRREAAQESLEIKRSKCDTVIDNSDSWEQTSLQLEAWLAQLPELQGLGTAP